MFREFFLDGFFLNWFQITHKCIDSIADPQVNCLVAVHSFSSWGWWWVVSHSLNIGLIPGWWKFLYSICSEQTTQQTDCSQLNLEKVNASITYLRIFAFAEFFNWVLGIKVEVFRDFKNQEYTIKRLRFNCWFCVSQAFLSNNFYDLNLVLWNQICFRLLQERCTRI